MAKHRRLSSKRPSTRKHARAPQARTANRPAGRGNGRATAVQEPPDLHLEAVRAYERGVEALQQRNYARAAELLRSVVHHYPEEKELHERVLLYLNVCERQAAPPDATPQTLEERVYAATLAINAGAYDSGLAQLQLALQKAPSNDHVHYMLGVVHALRRDFSSSLTHLQRAVELNAENRLLALQDADLAGLREADPSFRTTIEAALAARRDRRDAPRQRPSR